MILTFQTLLDQKWLISFLQLKIKFNLQITEEQREF